MANLSDRDGARRGRAAPPDDHPDDDIEILEVIGLDVDGAPIPGGDAGKGAGEGEEIVLDFEDEPRSRGDRPETPAPALPTVTLERFVRLRADFENYRKRTDREREEEGRYAAASIVARLLPVLDNLERALSSPPAGEVDRGLREGLAMIHRQFLEELRDAGLRPIEAVGESFDPSVHDAVETVVAPDGSAQTVVDELQRGYRFHDRVLRPALVRVAVGPDAGRSSDGSGEDA